MRSMITSALNLIPPWVLAGMPSVCKPLPEGIGCLTAQWTGGSVKDRDRGILAADPKVCRYPSASRDRVSKKGWFPKTEWRGLQGYRTSMSVNNCFLHGMSPI